MTTSWVFPFQEEKQQKEKPKLQREREKEKEKGGDRDKIRDRDRGREKEGDRDGEESLYSILLSGSQFSPRRMGKIHEEEEPGEKEGEGGEIIVETGKGIERRRGRNRDFDEENLNAIDISHWKRLTNLSSQKDEQKEEEKYSPSLYSSSSVSVYQSTRTSFRLYHASVASPLCNAYIVVPHELNTSPCQYKDRDRDRDRDGSNRPKECSPPSISPSSSSSSFCRFTLCEKEVCIPYILQHLILTGSVRYPYADLPSLLASHCLSSPPLPYSHIDHTAYQLKSTGPLGLHLLLPLSLEYILDPSWEMIEREYEDKIYHQLSLPSSASDRDRDRYMVGGGLVWDLLRKQQKERVVREMIEHLRDEKQYFFRQREQGERGIDRANEIDVIDEEIEKKYEREIVIDKEDREETEGEEAEEEERMQINEALLQVQEGILELKELKRKKEKNTNNNNNNNNNNNSSSSSSSRIVMDTEIEKVIGKEKERKRSNDRMERRETL
jgi:hypothetical protein